MELTPKTVEEIFDSALEIADSAERSVFLDRACAGHSGLRARVMKLLAAHERSEGFFNDCASALAMPGAGEQHEGVSLQPEPAEDPVGSTIGPYKLLQKIGEGGCGAVYMAEQEKPVRRRVALKIIKLGMDTRQVIARFEAERQALAIMDHPNIARVLDAGATETGRPYFVMELVHGIRITEFCDQRQLGTRARLGLFIQVCNAIQHAHQKGIIHRDIKPSNILVTLHDGVPVPKVIDFGIAKAMEEKLTDKTLFTMFGHFVGTPAYMSPEQAQMSGMDVDTRSDIYSLGVLLYELLTGKTPFEHSELMAAGLDEMRKTLREREPHRPSTKLDTLPNTELTVTAQRRHIEPPQLRSELQGDLDWIVMRALEKDRRRRYETANGLALEIERFLNNEPVLARPPSRLYRFQKLVRRNRVVFATVGAVSMALIVGLALSTWLFVRERESRRRAVLAEQEADEARQNEAELRRQAETREQIMQATLLASRDDLAGADAVLASIDVVQPTLEGTAILRKLGEWHALNGRWPRAADRFLQALQINQLDGGDTIARDFLRAGAALVASGDLDRYDVFRQEIATRFLLETNSNASVQALRAGLILPGQGADCLRPLGLAIRPASPTSIGNVRFLGPSAAMNVGQELQNYLFQNVGTTQWNSLRVEGDVVTLIAGGSDIWGNQDEFAYLHTLLSGDFDFRMQVLSVKPVLDDFTRVGLMAREIADSPNSRHVMVAFNASGSFQVITRSAKGAPADSVPHDPLPFAYGSNSWVRLQRAGAIFHAYTSSNGVDWLQLYQTTGGDRSFTDPINFGIAASSHDARAVATNVVVNFGRTQTVPATAALTLALWEYRNGSFEDAATWCRRLLDYPDCRMVETEMAHLVLSLACARLHQPVEARHQLEQARAMRQALPDDQQTGTTADRPWYDRVFALALMAEAQSLVE